MTTFKWKAKAFTFTQKSGIETPPFLINWLFLCQELAKYLDCSILQVNWGRAYGEFHYQLVSGWLTVLAWCHDKPSIDSPPSIWFESIVKVNGEHSERVWVCVCAPVCSLRVKGAACVNRHSSRYVLAPGAFGPCQNRYSLNTLQRMRTSAPNTEVWFPEAKNTAEEQALLNAP